jgi:hypothetical protein
MSAPPADGWGVMLGESLDLPINYAYACPNDPRADGSIFTLCIVDPNNTQNAYLIFSTADAQRSLEIINWVSNTSLELGFRASAQQVLQIPAGVYSGGILHNHPRDGVFGPRVTCVAVVTLTVIQP